MSMIKQGVLVAGGRLIDKVMSLAIVLVLSRHFGEEGLGEFNYFFSLACLFLPLMDVSSGMTLLQRWHDCSAPKRRLLMTQLVVLKFSLGGLALLLALGGDAINHWGHSNSWAVCAAFGAVFLDDFSELLRRPAHAQGNVLLEVALPLVSRVIQLAMMLAFLTRMTRGFQMIYIYVAANAVETLASFYGCRGCAPTTLSGTQKGDWWDLAKNGAPFAMSSLFFMASLHFDSVLLGHYSYREVGAYTAATRIIMVLNVLNGGICHALFPKLMKAKADQDPGHAGWLINCTLRAFTILFGSIAVGGITVGKGLMEVLYGNHFYSTGPLFQLLSPLILLSAFYSLMGQCLEILGEQAKVMRIYALSALVNVGGNFLLIPHYGTVGSAIATIFSSILTVGSLFYAIRKNPHLVMTFEGMGRAAIFLSILAILYLPLPHLNPWVAVPVGGALFAVLLIPFRRYWLEGMGRIAGEQTGIAKN